MDVLLALSRWSGPLRAESAEAEKEEGSHSCLHGIYSWLSRALEHKSHSPGDGALVLQLLANGAAQQPALRRLVWSNLARTPTSARLSAWSAAVARCEEAALVIGACVEARRRHEDGGHEDTSSTAPSPPPPSSSSWANNNASANMSGCSTTPALPPAVQRALLEQVLGLQSRDGHAPDVEALIAELTTSDTIHSESDDDAAPLQLVELPPLLGVYAILHNLRGRTSSVLRELLPPAHVVQPPHQCPALQRLDELHDGTTVLPRCLPLHFSTRYQRHCLAPLLGRDPPPSTPEMSERNDDGTAWTEHLHEQNAVAGITALWATALALELLHECVWGGVPRSSPPRTPSSALEMGLKQMEMDVTVHHVPHSRCALVWAGLVAVLSLGQGIASTYTRMLLERPEPSMLHPYVRGPQVADEVVGSGPSSTSTPSSPTVPKPARVEGATTHLMMDAQLFAPTSMEDVLLSEMEDCPMVAMAQECLRPEYLHELAEGLDAGDEEKPSPVSSTDAASYTYLTSSHAGMVAVAARHPHVQRCLQESIYALATTEALRGMMATEVGDADAASCVADLARRVVALAEVFFYSAWAGLSADASFDAPTATASTTTSTTVEAAPRRRLRLNAIPSPRRAYDVPEMKPVHRPPPPAFGEWAAPDDASTSQPTAATTTKRPREEASATLLAELLPRCLVGLAGALVEGGVSSSSSSSPPPPRRRLALGLPAYAHSLSMLLRTVPVWQRPHHHHINTETTHKEAETEAAAAPHATAALRAVLGALVAYFAYRHIATSVAPLLRSSMALQEGEEEGRAAAHEDVVKAELPRVQTSLGQLIHVLQTIARVWPHDARRFNYARYRPVSQVMLPELLAAARDALTHPGISRVPQADVLADVKQQLHRLHRLLVDGDEI